MGARDTRQIRFPSLGKLGFVLLAVGAAFLAVSGPALKRRGRPVLGRDKVDIASEDSFPASDPPGYY